MNFITIMNRREAYSGRTYGIRAAQDLKSIFNFVATYNFGYGSGKFAVYLVGKVGGKEG